MTTYEQLRCTRCECVNTFEKGNPLVRGIIAKGVGLLIGRNYPAELRRYCSCSCHDTTKKSNTHYPAIQRREYEREDEDVPF